MSEDITKKMKMQYMVLQYLHTFPSLVEGHKNVGKHLNLNKTVEDNVSEHDSLYICI